MWLWLCVCLVGCAKAVEAEGTPPLVAEARKPYRTPIAQGTSPSGGRRGRPFPCDTKKPTVLPVHKPKLETEKNGHLRLCQLIHAWFSSWVLPGGWPGCAGPWGCPISRMGLSYSNGSPAKAARKRHSQGARIGFVESMVIPLVLLIPGFKHQSSFGHDADVPVVQCVGEVVWMGCQST